MKTAPGFLPQKADGILRNSLQRQVALKVMDAADEEALQLRRGEFEVLRTVTWRGVGGDGAEAQRCQKWM